MKTHFLTLLTATTKMFNLAPISGPVRTTTGPKVGPNTYVICTEKDKRSCKNWAPFLSSNPKGPSFVKKHLTETIYDIREEDSQKRILGGSSLRNTAPRFVYKTDDGPGPVTYEPVPIKFLKKRPKCDPNKPKLYLCGVPYSATIVAPSIPTKLDENGYDIDHDGNIFKVPQDSEDFVDINIKSLMGEKGGCEWSARTCKRFGAGRYETDGPGPAGYFATLPKCRRALEEEEFREMARRLSFVPRFIEEQELRAAKENKPGPGAYDLTARGPRDARSKSIQPTPFIRRTERFSEKPEITPGPTDYDVCERKKSSFSMRNPPFGAVSKRFRGNEIKISPGPSDYEIRGALQEKVRKKKNPFAIFEPPFNTTVSREINFTKRDAPFIPSAANYPEVKYESEDETENEFMPSTVFKSAVARFYSPLEKKDHIGPAKYHPSPRRLISEASPPFHFSGRRSETPEVKLGVPCPTSYSQKLEVGTGGCPFSLSARFPLKEKDVPGPGNYNIHPRMESSTYKAIDTHNLRLKENVLHQKLRLAPKDTRSRWLKTMKKRKFLKWFDIELDFEDRMVMLIQNLFEKPV